ncbi:MAG: hypothetical protein CVU05_02255 [Bacteroidetes bacterium HGW-Bacteroidetes-21]|jgi:thiol-disulfide isomerase/thioredoxin|nr:MAG: hypothetical protein CVU05_02255 [Bacteroidetes bacterium HGW-Bacteroidetes-21]
MRNILLLSILISFHSCQNEDYNFEISGVINGGKGKAIFLSSTSENDSVVIDSDDGFLFKGKVKNGNFYNLYFDKTRPILLYVDSGNVIKIQAEIESFDKIYNVEGSDVSSDIKTLQGKLEATYNKIKSIYDENMKNADSTKIDSIKNIITLETNKTVNEHRDFILDFIRKNPSSFAVLPAIYQSFDARTPIFSYLNDYVYFRMVDSALMATNPKSVHTQDFHSQVIQYKRQYDSFISQQTKPVEMQTAPDFKVMSPEGKMISLSSFRGKYVLLDFWASWCGPCRKENPNLVNAYRIFKKKNFTIFQVSLDNNKPDWIAAIDKDKLGEWSHGSDLKYWESEPGKLYNVGSIPSNFLINPDGVIIAQDLRGEDLQNKLKEVLK